MGSRVLLLLVVYNATSDAFLFNRKLNCLVSQWSEWSQPFGFGQLSRERKVLRYPTKGGADCPTNLEDIQYTGTHVTSQISFAAIIG